MKPFGLLDADERRNLEVALIRGDVEVYTGAKWVKANSMHGSFTYRIKPEAAEYRDYPIKWENRLPSVYLPVIGYMCVSVVRYHHGFLGFVQRYGSVLWVWDAEDTVAVRIKEEAV